MSAKRIHMPVAILVSGMAVILSVWLLRKALMPFFVAMVLAYLMAPPVKILERWMKRGPAAMLVLLGFFASLGLAIWMLVPLLSGQVQRLMDAMPHWRQACELRFGPWTQAHPRVEAQLHKAMEGIDPMVFLRGLQGAGAGLLAGALQVMALMLVPIIVYYLLVDGPELIRGLELRIPPRYRSRLWEILHRINERLGGYIRGELALAVVMALLHGTALRLLGVPHAWILGWIAGFSNVVPYSPYLTALAPALILVGLEGGGWTRILGVAIVFLLVQKIEAFYLTPVWVGRASKLHPLEVLLGVLCFGFAFGILGLIFAIPLMIVLKVLSEVFLADYVANPWFKGEDPGDPGQESVG